MDTMKITPAIDFGIAMRIKDRLEAGNLISKRELDALHRISMFYGFYALGSLE